MTIRDVWSTLWAPRSSFNKAFNSAETFVYLDGSKYYTWPAVRRQNINRLASDVLHITIFLTASGALGPDQAMYQHVGTNPSKYGIVYWLGGFGWWVFALVISPVLGLLWFPLFKWISPPKPTRTTTEIVTDENGLSHTITKETFGGVWYYIALINKYLYAGSAYIRVFEFVFHLYETILQVNGRPVHSSSLTCHAIDARRNWLTRVGLAAGMLIGVGLGVPVMILWNWLDLVHVTMQEYALIIVPVQMTIGVALASVLQAILEKKRALPTEKELFEKEANGELTLEGMRQALSFLVNSEIDMKALQNIAREKDKDRKDQGKVEMDKSKGEKDDGEARVEENIDRKLTQAPSEQLNEKLVEV